MRRILLFFVLLAVQTAWADRIILNNGESFEGDFFGATSQEIRFVVDGKLMTFMTTEVSTIHFGDAPPAEAKPQPAATPAGETAPSKPSAAAPAPAPGPTSEPAAAPASEPPPEPEPARTSEPVARRTKTSTGAPTIRLGGARPASSKPAPEIVAGQPAENEDDSAPPAPRLDVPRGTRLTVRLNEDIDTRINKSGETFRATLEKPVLVNGDEVIPGGTEAWVRLVNNQRASNSESWEMAVDLTALVIEGSRVSVTTTEVRRVTRGSKKEKVAGGLARAGKRLGTILAGGMGGPVGDTAEDTVDIATDADEMTVSAGTLLSFTLLGAIHVEPVPVQEFTD